MYKYPTEIYSVLRKNKTLSITSALFAATPENGEKPLTVFGKFSRFPITVINTSTHPKKILKANIEIDQLADLFFRTEAAYRKEIEMSFQTAAQPVQQQANKTLGYTVALTMGTYKGQTPAQVLLKEGNTDGLLRQRAFLAQNAAKFPANVTQINAIDDAIWQFSNGTLSREVAGNADAASGQKLVLYAADMRPNMYKRRQDGKYPVTIFHINWVFGNKYPVQIELGVYYAPVQRLADGRLNVMVAQKSDSVSENYLLSAGEWLNCLSRIKRNIRQFEIVTAKYAFESSRKAEEANRLEAKARANTQQAASNVYQRQQQAQPGTGNVYPQGFNTFSNAGAQQSAYQNPQYAQYQGMIN